MPRSRRSLITLASFVVLVAGCPSPATSEEGSTTTKGTSSESEVTTSDETGTSTGTETGTDEPPCPGQTPTELMDCVESARYEADLEFVAQLRTPGTSGWLAVQELCADRLSELGYAVELHDYGTGINVLGTREGSSLADEQVIVGAHYDHIPECTGADDNATGVAAALELARVLAEVPTPRTLVIACWDEEELGLLGSDAHAQTLVDAGESVSAVFSLDMIGYTDDSPGAQVVPTGFDLLFPEQYAELEANEFRADFLLWVSDDTMIPIGEAFDQFAASVGLPTLGTSLDDTLKNADLLSDLRRSDHASFWARDIPAMYVNDTGEFRYSSYHCSDGADDSLDQVDVGFAVQVSQATIASTAVALGL